MDIWILVIVLLVIAIILFGLSVLAPEQEDDEVIENQNLEQAQAIDQLTLRLDELERQAEDDKVSIDVYEEIIEETPELVVNEEVFISDEMKEQIIQLYSHGYTMNEISEQIELDPQQIRQVVDEYIESR